MGAEHRDVIGDSQPAQHADPANELQQCSAALELEKVAALARQNLDPGLNQRIGRAFALQLPADRLCEWQDQDTVIESVHSVKSSDYVRRVASKDIVVCVLDSRNRLTRLILNAGESRSVGGATRCLARSANHSNQAPCASG